MSGNGTRQSLVPPEPINERINAARTGSAETLGQLLEGCRGYLLLIANTELDSRLRAKGGASDLVQETFLEAHQSFQRFRGHTQRELLAWLRQILLSHMANFRRQYRQTRKRQLSREVSLWREGLEGPTVHRPIAAEDPSPSWIAVAREERDILERALAKLSDIDRTVIGFVHRDRLSFVETGKRMNRTADSIRGIWSRAIVRLTREVEAAYETE